MCLKETHHTDVFKGKQRHHGSYLPKQSATLQLSWLLWFSGWITFYCISNSCFLLLISRGVQVGSLILMVLLSCLLSHVDDNFMMVVFASPNLQVLKKTKYLCIDAFYEDYFSFKCLKKAPASGKEWYTICGTAFPNHMEYIVVVSSFCVLGLFWYWQLILRSGSLPRGRSPRRHLKKE